MAGERTGVVIDVGCATHGPDRSVEPLVERFHPVELHGFDPQVFPMEMSINGTLVKLIDRAAWVTDGTVQFHGYNLGARVVDTGGRAVACFDLAAYIGQLDRPVVKLDAEGSEYRIVERLIDTGTDASIELLLVEWHCHSCGHGIWSHALTCDQMDEAEAIASGWEQRLACPTERWEL